MAAGLLGTLLPFLPGIPLIYAGYLFYGLATGWQDYGLCAMAAWGLVVGVVTFLDLYAKLDRGKEIRRPPGMPCGDR